MKAQVVSADYFDVRKLKVARGRAFRPEEGEPGKAHLVLLSHRYWQAHLGGDAGVVGKTITLDGSAYTLIGTLPADSWFDRSWTDVWVPLALNYAASMRDFHYLEVRGRIRDGMSVGSARAELDAIAVRIAHEYPDTNKGWGVTVDRLVDRAVSPQLRTSLHVLLAAVGVVLLIGCVNLANLLLARSAARQREIWVRLAIGAGRGRLIRQFLAESLTLSCIGGVVGLALGYSMLHGLLFWMPKEMLPPQADVQAVTDVKLLDEIKAESTGDTRFRTSILGIFATIALLLAAIGIYGVVSDSVAQRMREMGIRSALGASSRELLRSAIYWPMLFTTFGIALGVIGSLGTGRFLSALLFNTSPMEPVTMLAVTLAIVAVAALAAYVPARRAAKVDPLIALRYE